LTNGTSGAQAATANPAAKNAPLVACCCQAVTDGLELAKLQDVIDSRSCVE